MRKSQGKPADIWSVGCVIIEMLTGDSAWKDHSMEEFTRKISSGGFSFSMFLSHKKNHSSPTIP